MFRKLVTNLSFSPSLIGTLGPYNLRLKQEESRRKIGLFFLTLALIAQALAVSFPPESANSANQNDIIYGGVPSLDALLAKYDRNEQNLQDIYTSLGITRAEIASLTHKPVRLNGDYYITGRTSQVSTELGEITHQFSKTPNGHGTLYLVPAHQLDAAIRNYTYKTYDALVGNSSQAGPFAVITASGNIALKQALHTSSPKHTDCTKPKNTSSDSSDCTRTIAYTKSATNTTQNELAERVIARTSDRIVYTIRAKNMTHETIEASFSDNLADVLEYASLLNTNGGSYNESTKVISWPDTPIKAGETTSRSFSVRMSPHMPATPQGLGNPMSYDCIMRNTNTNTVSIHVACPAPKFIETVTTELPRTPTPIGIGAGIITFTTALYLYLRTRQQREELRLIRKDINAGTL